MTTKAAKSVGLHALEKAIASLSCEGIALADKEKAPVQQMSAQGLSWGECLSRLNAYLTDAQPQS